MITLKDHIISKAVDIEPYYGYGIAWFLDEQDAEDCEYLARKELHFYEGGLFDGFEHSRRVRMDKLIDGYMHYATTFDLKKVQAELRAEDEQNSIL